MNVTESHEYVIKSNKITIRSLSNPLFYPTKIRSNPMNTIKSCTK
jgi:hypothetical protein